ncbi:hypothetical protein DFH09DRAFT_938401 [Mycena vulgaris]|nr:hypothetical protein DFH09DRAFT_938401 [Mycena vulgaris]
MAQLEDPHLGAEYILAIQEVDVVDIMDKSNGDALSKGVVLALGVWLPTHVAARASNHLEMKNLESVTAAFVVANIPIWLFW